jgi:hypothetical protein
LLAIEPALRRVDAERQLAQALGQLEDAIQQPLTGAGA